MLKLSSPGGHRTTGPFQATLDGDHVVISPVRCAEDELARGATPSAVSDEQLVAMSADRARSDDL
ncbi:hypothetical protein [Streptomyces bobili]|uniref:hypothetical protein n=1 Tax=Streptomyces bobili TaxID=67280 RepID=UPI003721583D